MRVKVYLAAALSNASAVRALGDVASTAMPSVIVVSTWHDEVSDNAVDPHSRELRNGILRKNIDQLGCADVVMADTRYGLPCATFGEIAYALALQIPVIWIQPESRRADGVRASNIFDAHELVSVVYDAGEAIKVLQTRMVGAACDTKFG